MDAVAMRGLEGQRTSEAVSTKSGFGLEQNGSSGVSGAENLPFVPP
jgi:hypothetical protein